MNFSTSTKYIKYSLQLFGSALTDPLRLYHLCRRIYHMVRYQGFNALRNHLVMKAEVEYQLWFERYGVLTEDDRIQIKNRLAKLKYKPLISVVMPVYNTDEKWLRAVIESVRNQLYTNWEFCIADDLSPRSHVKKILNEYAEKDSRIKVVYRETNGHISEASNSALKLVTGEFVALLDHDDEMTEHALYMMVEELNKYPDSDLIYSDEDKIDMQGRVFDPHFKPKWNPDLFYSQNYICHLGLYRTSIIKKIGGFRRSFDGSQDYDLVLRVIEESTHDKIHHVPHVLYHWRAIPGSVALNSDQKSYAHERARMAIREHLIRMGIQGRVIRGYGPLHRVFFPVSVEPKVSLIIPTKDRVDLLEELIRGVLEETDYDHFEILVVDNQSVEPKSRDYFEKIKSHPKIRVLSYDHPFNFSALNNFAAKQAHGEILAFLNNDLEVIAQGWLRELVGHAMRKEIGIVGAKLYYENGLVQHAGVILGMVGGVAGHSHKGLKGDAIGYHGRLQVHQNLSAVTGACMLMRKGVFDKVGGFDENNLPIAYNDVDLCLKVKQEGLRVLFTPFAELLHKESATRGPDSTPEKTARLKREADFMKAKWGPQLAEDPCYSPNLTIDKEDFSYAFPPRVTKPWRAVVKDGY